MLDCSEHPSFKATLLYSSVKIMKLHPRHSSRARALVQQLMAVCGKARTAAAAAATPRDIYMCARIVIYLLYTLCSWLCSLLLLLQIFYRHSGEFLNQFIFSLPYTHESISVFYTEKIEIDISRVLIQTRVISAKARKHHGEINLIVQFIIHRMFRIELFGRKTINIYTRGIG